LTGRWTCIGLLAVLPCISHAAFEELPVGARALAMGGARAYPWAPFCLEGNPAGLALKSGFSVAAYATRLFGESDLLFACAEVDLPRLGFSASTFGGSIYRETVLAAGSGLSHGGMSFGISAKAMLVSILGYGSDALVGIDTGAAARLNRTAIIGVSATNVNLPAVGSSIDGTPQILSLSVTLVPYEGSLFCADLAERVGDPPEILLGMELALADGLLLRSGMNPSIGTYSLGFALGRGAMSIEHSVMAHDPLGLTQGTSVCYRVSGR
jgi:hypothetical protein